MNFIRRLFAPNQATPALTEGGLYALSEEKGKYKVLKVLKVDDGGVHVRLYSNVFAARPTHVDESTLYMAGANRQPDEPMGMGHLPISHRSFASWNAIFFQQSRVADDELEGYQMWVEANGGYF